MCSQSINASKNLIFVPTMEFIKSIIQKRYLQIRTTNIPIDQIKEAINNQSSKIILTLSRIDSMLLFIHFKDINITGYYDFDNNSLMIGKKLIFFRNCWSISLIDSLNINFGIELDEFNFNFEIIDKFICSHKNVPIICWRFFSNGDFMINLKNKDHISRVFDTVVIKDNGKLDYMKLKQES